MKFCIKDLMENFIFVQLMTTLSFIYKQPVYKQLSLGCQIAKQFSGLNPFSLSNNKNYRLKKNWVFLL